MILRRFCCFAAVMAVSVVGMSVGKSQETPAPATQPAAGQAEKPKSPASYYLGLAIAEQMKGQGLTLEDMDIASFAMALQDELSGKGPRLNQEELQAASNALRLLMQGKVSAMQKEFEELAAANKEKADLFLQQNAKEEGIQTLPSGVQYKVVRDGNGASPKLSNVVRVHYTGKLLNGEVFDSSVERGQPAEFQLSGLIEAWKEALPKMKVGSKWILYVPPAMGYGAQPPRGSSIGPNDLLIFEMELLDIVQ